MRIFEPIYSHKSRDSSHHVRARRIEEPQHANCNSTVATLTHAKYHLFNITSTYGIKQWNVWQRNSFRIPITITFHCLSSKEALTKNFPQCFVPRGSACSRWVTSKTRRPRWWDADGKAPRSARGPRSRCGPCARPRGTASTRRRATSPRDGGRSASFSLRQAAERRVTLIWCPCRCRYCANW